jgi:hypothetical protein
MHFNPGRSSGRETVLKPAVPGVPASAGLKDRAWDNAVVPGGFAERLQASVADICVWARAKSSSKWSCETTANLLQKMRIATGNCRSAPKWDPEENGLLKQLQVPALNERGSRFGADPQYQSHRSRVRRLIKTFQYVAYRHLLHIKYDNPSESALRRCAMLSAHITARACPTPERRSRPSRNS